jgi:hypothetical protein
VDCVLGYDTSPGYYNVSITVTSHYGKSVVPPQFRWGNAL